MVKAEGKTQRSAKSKTRGAKTARISRPEAPLSTYTLHDFAEQLEAEESTEDIGKDTAAYGGTEDNLSGVVPRAMLCGTGRPPDHANTPAEKAAEEILRRFDMTVAYGPCRGISRLDRHNRAARMGLSPPTEVKRILEASPPSFNKSAFDQELS